MKSAVVCAVLFVLLAVAHGEDKATNANTAVTAQKTETHGDSVQAPAITLLDPVTILEGLDTPVVVSCNGPSCPQDETVITCTGPLLPPFSHDPNEFCKDKEPCDRDVLSRMKRLWEQREKLAHQEQAERVAQRECLFRQMEKHRKDIIQLNAAAAKIRDKFLELAKYKANLQTRMQALDHMMQDINVKTAEDYARIQRNRALELEKAHQKAKEEEEAAKAARVAAMKAKREREQKEDELEREKAELQKMEIEEEKVKVQEQKQKTLAKLRRDKQANSKRSSHSSKQEVDEHTKLDPEDSVKAKEVETHGHDDEEEEEDDKKKKEDEEDEEENEKKIEKLLHTDDEDRGPVGKLPRKFTKTQKAIIVDQLNGGESSDNSTLSQEAEEGESRSRTVDQREEEEEGDDNEEDGKKVHIKINGADMVVTKKDLEAVQQKKNGQDDEGDEEGAEPKPAPQKVQSQKDKEKEQVHKTVQKEENSAKEALKQAEQLQKEK